MLWGRQNRDMKVPALKRVPVLRCATLCVSFILCACAAPPAMPQDNVAPKGFKALFNGKDLAGWKSKGNASDHWSVSKEGELVYDGKGSRLDTVENFENFALLIDWKVQKDGNSGVYLRGTTQVEINDHDRPPRKIWNGTTGGLYPDKPPIKRASLPTGEWNHFEITVDKGVITVLTNGEKTIDRYAKKWGKNTSGSIGFQHHGKPLWFKNIYIKPLPK
jgi:hypothetical protein